MLGFKNGTDREPAYDYYIETDLDSLDEPPVDYSTKYQEQDGYKDTRSLNFKVNNIPLEIHSKEESNDEVKVYYTKDTPQTPMSPASSFCDLPDIVANSDRSTLTNINKEELFEEKPLSLSQNDCSKDEIKIDKTSESEKEGLLKGSLKVKESSKKEKCVSFGGSSVTQTPLMFSRSSSVDSLSSFEQQSIIDDRSYVSALSTTASGIISPSDLPASPSELMSSKSKSEFRYPDSKNNNLVQSIDFKLKEHNNDIENLCDGVFGDTQRVFNDEGHFSSTSSLSSLSFSEGESRASISLLHNNCFKQKSEKPLVDVSNDEAPSYVFDDAKTEYKYEGQLASNIPGIYDQNPQANHYFRPDFNSGLIPLLPNDVEQEYLSSSFAFEDTKNVYNDEGKFSTTSSLSSISFLDNTERSPTKFELDSTLSRLGANYICAIRSDNSTGLKNQVDPQPVTILSQSQQRQSLWRNSESLGLNNSISLQTNRVCDGASESESDYDSEQERKDAELISQLLAKSNPIEVPKIKNPPVGHENAGVGYLSPENGEVPIRRVNNSLESPPAQVCDGASESESDYDSEQERKDAQLISQLLSKSDSIEMPKNKNPSVTSSSRANNSLETFPAQVCDAASQSESDYDSEQERKDAELISQLLTNSKPLEVPKLKNPTGEHLAIVSERLTPENGENSNRLVNNSLESPSAQVESSESDYDLEQERKDQELINKLLEMKSPPVQDPRRALSNQLSVEMFKGEVPKGRKSAPPNIFTCKATRTAWQAQGTCTNTAKEVRCDSGCLHVRVESSESDHDSEQERKDNMLINALISQGPKPSDRTPMYQTSELLSSRNLKDRNHAPSKIFATRTCARTKQGLDSVKEFHSSANCQAAEVCDNSSESEYDSEQERKDQELINQLISRTNPVQLPVHTEMSKSQISRDRKSNSTRIVPSKSSKISHHVPVQKNYASNQVQKSSQYQACDNSSESEYDSDQERKDRELINQLLSRTNRMQMTRHMDAPKPQVVPKDRRSALPKMAPSKSSRIVHHPIHRSEPSRQMPKCSHCQVGGESSESDYDSDLERKDQEIVNRLIAQKIPLHMPKAKSPPSRPYVPRDVRKPVHYYIPEDRKPDLRSNHHHFKNPHISAYRDRFPDGSSDIGDKTSKPAPKSHNVKKAEKVTKNAKYARQSFDSKDKRNHCAQRSFKTPAQPQSNLCDKKHAVGGAPRRVDHTVVHSSSAPWLLGSNFIEIDCIRTYRTEDTPIISRSPSLTDLNLRPGNDKSGHENLKNARK